MKETVAVLMVEGGPNSDQMIPLIGGRNVMGREISADVVDTETGVSRKHAEIVETVTGYLLSDLSSSNGTFVNGKRVETQHLLRDGDEITLGPSKVKFIFKSDRADTAVITLPLVVPSGKAAVEVKGSKAPPPHPLIRHFSLPSLQTLRAPAGANSPTLLPTTTLPTSITSSLRYQRNNWSGLGGSWSR